MEHCVARSIAEFLEHYDCGVIVNNAVKRLQDIEIKSIGGTNVIIFDPYYMQEDLKKNSFFKKSNPKIKLVALNSLLLCFDNRGGRVESMLKDGALDEYLDMPASLEDILKAVAG